MRGGRDERGGMRNEEIGERAGSYMTCGCLEVGYGRLVT